jgi:S-formylglutathione hydrolase FrmB
MKQLGIFLGFWLLFAGAVNAARVDSIAVDSKAMGVKIKAMVILPDKAFSAQAQRCPTIYLLNGYDGNEKQWPGIKSDLPKIADEKGIIFVCPDGKNSWYLDSPLDKTSQYETFISVELIQYIDKNYQTLADRKHRAITGLSMGGHGALFNAFRHKDVFGAVGSTSGAVDIRQRGDNYGLVHLLGDITKNPKNWESLSILNQIEKVANGDLAIIFDCGVSDFTFPLNEALNKALWKKGIDHEYITRQGNHNAGYWRNAIDYHILFFSKFFSLP